MALDITSAIVQCVVVFIDVMHHLNSQLEAQHQQLTDWSSETSARLRQQLLLILNDVVYFNDVVFPEVWERLSGLTDSPDQLGDAMSRTTQLLDTLHDYVFGQSSLPLSPPAAGTSCLVCGSIFFCCIERRLISAGPISPLPPASPVSCHRNLPPGFGGPAQLHTAALDPLDRDRLA